MADALGRAPFVGFAGIHFSITRDAEGVYRDWTFRPRVITRHIPGSNRADVQHMGTPPATVTWRLGFAPGTAYPAFVAKLGTQGRLTILAGREGSFTSAKGIVQAIHDQIYEHLDGVLLLAVEETAFQVDGYVECNATFMRAMNPLDGQAVSS